LGISKSKLLRRFPFFGRFSSVVPDRGFAFIEMGSGRNRTEYFAHTSSEFGASNSIAATNLVGENCLFSVGPRSAGDQRLTAISWCLLDKVAPGHEGVWPGGYSKVRADLLENSDIKSICSWLEAGWLKKLNFQGQLKDPLFDTRPSAAPLGIEIIIKAVQSCSMGSPEMIALGKTLEESPYDLGLYTEWLAEDLSRSDNKLYLLNQPLDELLEVFSPQQLSEVFSPPLDADTTTDPAFLEKVFKWSVLGSDKSRVLRDKIGTDELWLSMIEESAIGIDLESDGRTIRQIGSYQNRQKQIWFDEDNESKDITAQGAIKNLTQDASKYSILVGHNFIYWDLPQIIRTQPGLERIPVWDTMLVRLLLKPAASTMALMSTHNAGDDAKASFNLFMEQVKKIGAKAVGEYLFNGQKTSHELLEMIIPLVEGISETPRHPEWLAEILRGNKFNHHVKNMVFKNPQIRTLSWLSNICISTDGSSIPDPAQKQIDLTALLDSIHKMGHTSPFLSTLEGIARIALARKITLRKTDLPIWLVEKKEVIEVINECFAWAENANNSVRFMSYPTNVDWYTSDQIKASLFVDPPANTFHICERISSSSSEMPETIIDFLTDPNTTTPKFIRAKSIDTAVTQKWMRYDQAYDQLETDDRCWTIESFIAVSNFNKHISSEAQKPKLKFLDNDASYLFPGSSDLENYWIEVIERTITSFEELDLFNAVPVLFISTTGSPRLIELLRDAIAAIDRAPQKLPHHSRQRWLQLAQSVTGPCLVDHIDSLSDWITISRSCEIEIYPVIEALPMEGWIASLLATKKITIDQSDNDTDLNDVETAGDENVSHRLSDAKSSSRHLQIGDRDILRHLPQLLENELVSWANFVGLPAGQEALLIDPRLSARASMSYHFFEGVHLSANLNSDELGKISLAVDELASQVGGIPETSYDVYRKFLNQYWGYDDFGLETQAPAIDAIRSRDADVLITLPTGAGKSVVFQVPALYRGLISRKLTIVISPLRQLMRDQVANLWEKKFGESVEYITAERPWHELEEVYQGILDRRVTLIYVAPERFRNRKFISAITRRSNRDEGFEFIVIDEAHCVDQWGFDFRPDYIFAVELIAKIFRNDSALNPPPFLMLSATVTAPTKHNLETITEGYPPNKRPFEFKVKPDGYWHPVRNHITPTPENVLGSINARDPEEWDLDTRIDAIMDVISIAKKQNETSRQHGSIIIFVSRRSHAEEVAARIAGSKLVTVDFFHAGLDVDEKQDRFDKFNNGVTEVLVATKAFGMGIDIPHIFWAIHLSPPNFLEDYLQEIGRIGRGEKERVNAGLDKLDARLLFSESDFESIHANIQRNQVGFPEIYDFWMQIIERAKSISSERHHIAIVPEDGFQPHENGSARSSDSSKVRKFLFWLERLKRLEMVATLPSLLEVEVDSLILKKTSNEEGALAEIASSILSLVNEVSSSSLSTPLTTQEANTRDTSSAPTFLRLSSIVGSVVGFILGTKNTFDTSTHTATHNAQPKYRSAPGSTYNILLDLGYLYKSTSLESVDSVLDSITHLVKIGAVRVHRKLKFSSHQFSNIGSEAISLLFQCVEDATVNLILASEGKRNYNLAELEAIEVPQLNAIAELQIDHMELASVLRKVSIRTAQSSGVKIQKIISEDGLIEETSSLAENKGRLSISRVKNSFRLAQSIWNVVANFIDEEDSSVELSTLMDRCLAVNQPVQLTSVNKAMRIISWMRLASTSDRLIPMSYVVGLRDIDRKLEEEECSEVIGELADVNRMSELRGQAMEIFTYLPSEEARNKFVETYFEQETIEEIETFLLDQIRQVDDVDGGGWVATKLSQIRAEEITKHFARYKRKDAAEPNQWAAISHPFNKSLIVNAGPGSGKTGVLVARLVHLIYEQKVPPERIIVLAFNRAVVFEIRARIRRIFSALGYGAYVRRLRISTFHSLAVRQMGDPKNSQSLSLGKERNQIPIDAVFAEKLCLSTTFASDVAADAQVILVDEFQDVNDEILQILIQISRASGASVTAIGDDDQDIYSWNRSPQKSSNEYFNDFASTFGLECSSVDLSVNFRSNRKIVDVSQIVINHIIGKDRIKENTLLRPLVDKDTGIVQRIEEGHNARIDVIEATKEWIQSSQDNGESLAILCRTNNEVAELLEIFRRDFPTLIIQGRANLLLKNLRHVAEWLDCINDVSDSAESMLDKHLRKHVEESWKKKTVPEARFPTTHPVDVWKIWEICTDERSFARVHHLERLLQYTKTDDFDRMRSWTYESSVDTGNEPPPIILSTIHKVKGLEFDNVVIVPSTASFPFLASQAAGDLNLYRTDEAKLFYVGMTRARERLLYALGERELAWVKNLGKWRGPSGNRLLFSGDKEEIKKLFISYSGFREQIQDYIEQNVAVGDKLILREREILHGSEKIVVGRFRNSIRPRSNGGDLSVAGVIRYPVNEDYFDRCCKPVQERGWLFLVLIEGWIETQFG
jgi:superfamily II DNA helicase RecQ/superfamily I DNA/RNA helicase